VCNANKMVGPLPFCALLHIAVLKNGYLRGETLHQTLVFPCLTALKNINSAFEIVTPCNYTTIPGTGPKECYPKLCILLDYFDATSFSSPIILSKWAT
jgi:hypothetical protein